MKSVCYAELRIGENTLNYFHLKLPQVHYKAELLNHHTKLSSFSEGIKDCSAYTDAYSRGGVEVLLDFHQLLQELISIISTAYKTAL